MSVIEKLFWFGTVPGAYIAVSCLVYKVLRITICKGEDPEDAKSIAALWIITVPFLLVIGGILWVFNSLFDMVDGGDDNAEC